MEWKKKLVIVTISCFVTLLFAIPVIYFYVIVFQDMAKDVRSLKVITKTSSSKTVHSLHITKSKESKTSPFRTTMTTASQKRHSLNYAQSNDDTSTYTITKTTALQQSRKDMSDTSNQGLHAYICEFKAGHMNTVALQQRAITCPALPPPTDGSVTFTNGKNINSKATFSCNAGFTLDRGDRLRVCHIHKAKDAGVWDRQSPKCLAITCRHLPAPVDGSVTFTDGKKIKSKATFSCNAGFTLGKGDRFRVCQLHEAKSIWDRQSPKCLETPCVLGPFGGRMGNKFSDRKSIKHGFIIGLYITTDKWKIKCVGFIRGGVKNYCFGGTGPNVYEVKFKAGEYITGVKGATGIYGKYVDEITFITNLNSYGPYGGKRKGSIFSTDFKGRSLVYISGRSGSLLNQITFHLSC